jgi:hypothetical protein
MSVKRRKSRAREAIIAAERRCVYCSASAETVEHMPPRAMFRDSLRPSDMEYGACEDCNGGTRGSDAVAAIFARVHPNNGDESWQNAELRKLRPAVEKFAPGVLEEIGNPYKSRISWIPRPNSGLRQRVVLVSASGPLVKAHLTVFGAKLGMALYREHIGEALPLDGAVWCQFALNAGMTQKDLEERIKILPGYETLRQGKKNVADQFAYRFNTDERTVVAAVIQFHRSLWYTIFASSDQRIIELFAKPEFLKLPASAMIKPGSLLDLLPTTVQHGPMQNRTDIALGPIP